MTDKPIKPIPEIYLSDKYRSFGQVFDTESCARNYAKHYGYMVYRLNDIINGEKRTTGWLVCKTAKKINLR